MLVLAGCVALPLLGSCGPGETRIGEIDGNISNVSLEGEITETGDSLLVIDDTTGTAEVLVLGNLTIDGLDTDDCLVVEGSGATTGESEADVVVVASDLDPV